MKRAAYSYAQNLSGKTYWSSLAELQGEPSFTDAASREFPEGASDAPSDPDRRRFLSIMGASLALAGLVSCRRPEEVILPYTRAPEEVVIGNPLLFATALPFFGTAFGVLVESHEGRPTKIEGNPRHPESLGAATGFLQASILDLYDPDRSDAPRERHERRNWDEASAFLRRTGDALRAKRGKGLAIVTEGHRSPTLRRALEELRSAMPEAKVVRWDPFSREVARQGARLAFGRRFEPVLDFTKAKVIVALDADPLSTEFSPIKQAQAFAAGRKAPKPGDVLNRLYSVESSFSITGANADHRLRLESRRVRDLTVALAIELASSHGIHCCDGLRAPSGLGDREQRFVKAIAADLVTNKGQSVVIAGLGQPESVHGLVALMNYALGNTGTTIRYVAPFDPVPEAPDAMVKLAASMKSGAVDTLLLLGTNPAFDAPSDSGFAEAVKQVPVSIHLASSVDETSSLATWHLNRAHVLESWGDVQSEDGTASIIQPLIAPLFGGRTDAEVVDLLLGRGRKAYAMVQETWQAMRADLDFDKAFRRALHTGYWEKSPYPAVLGAPQPELVAQAINQPAVIDGLEVTFRPDPHSWDGRFANNGWLQELPDPIHKLTWGNVAAISPKLARDLHLHDGDVIALTVSGDTIRIPVLVAPGQAENSIALTVGQGRRQVGRVGTGVGTDVGPVRKSSAFSMASGATVSATGERVALARTQEHFQTESRPLVREGTAHEYAADPEFAQKKVEHLPLFSLFPERPPTGHAWGMTIDLNACIGCNACTLACQAENNIPIVGMDGVQRTREMHWIRVDRYFEGASDEDPTSVAQPMLCNHCENAPCEQVCPVGATAHSPEGLNDMAYNRCVGTRYCANNCPFKVRRFNFLDYTGGVNEATKMQRNPDVSVRNRGVMEKCTFCVQRINRAKIEAKREGHDRVRDGAVKTACQQACPAQAINFGDLEDPTSAVAHAAKSPLAYKVLEELNVRPRVSYLARVRNPNPALEGV